MAMRMPCAQLSDGALDDRDARLPAGMGAGIEDARGVLGPIAAPEGKRDLRVIACIGEQRDRQHIGLQLGLPEVADIAADARQQAIADPARFQPVTMVQDIMRQLMRDRRGDPVRVFGEEAAADLYQLAIRLRDEAAAQHHLKA